MQAAKFGQDNQIAESSNLPVRQGLIENPRWRFAGFGYKIPLIL
jgi:hypothetical protein